MRADHSRLPSHFNKSLDFASNALLAAGPHFSLNLQPAPMKHHKVPSFPVRHLFVALAALLSTATSRAAEPALTLKDNDVWVMAGDSITAQRMHTNYIEAYYRTRYPKLKLHFHNS